MIQDIGGLAYDNHFVLLEPCPHDHVLHYRDRSALVRASRWGRVPPTPVPQVA